MGVVWWWWWCDAVGVFKVKCRKKLAYFAVLCRLGTPRNSYPTITLPYFFFRYDTVGNIGEGSTNRRAQRTAQTK